MLLFLIAGCGEGDGRSSMSSYGGVQEGVIAVISAPVVAKVGEEFILDGSHSASGGEGELDYRWSVLEEPGLGALKIESSSEPVTAAVASLEGVYRLSLTVSRGALSNTMDYELYVEPSLPPEEDSPNGEDSPGECFQVNEYVENTSPEESLDNVH